MCRLRSYIPAGARGCFASGPIQIEFQTAGLRLSLLTPGFRSRCFPVLRRGDASPAARRVAGALLDVVRGVAPRDSLAECPLPRSQCSTIETTWRSSVQSAPVALRRGRATSGAASVFTCSDGVNPDRTRAVYNSRLAPWKRIQSRTGRFAPVFAARMRSRLARARFDIARVDGIQRTRRQRPLFRTAPATGQAITPRTARAGHPSQGWPDSVMLAATIRNDCPFRLVEPAGIAAPPFRI